MLFPEVAENGAIVPYEYPATDPVGPRIAIIGEAPGAEEAKQGRPFVGRSGQLLDTSLVNAGLRRENCLIANIFRIRPPNNKIGHFFASKSRARQEGLTLAEEWGKLGSGGYCLAEYGGELAHLREALREWRPTAIVALGQTPLWGLTGQHGITTLRGQPLPCTLLTGLTVIPTYHPSYILRGNWKCLPEFEADLRLAEGM